MPTLASDLLTALDPVALARRVGITPDPWQAEVLRTPARQLVLNCCRQSGKSTMAALLASHVGLYEPGAPIILLSPSERQSVELLRKVRATLTALGQAAPALSVDNVLGLELANGSRLLALPGREGTIRGFSGVRLLVIDEAARVPDPLYQSVRPMLAVSGGRLVLLSTPFGKRGFFHHEWTQGEDWARFEVPATAIPRIDPAWLEKERRAIGDFWFEQEYLCQFKETSDAVFAYEDVAAMLDSETAPLFPLAAEQPASERTIIA
jgi:hypothetical protein